MNKEELKTLLTQSASTPLPPWETHYLDVHITRYLKTLDLLGPGENQKLLDVGAFPGHLAMAAQKLGYEVFALTGRAESTTCLDLIGDRFTAHRIPLAFADVEKNPFPYPDESFDVVLASEIIEHLHFNPFRMLKESFRVLKPQGRIFLSTPNLARLENLWLLFKERTIHSDLRRRFDEVFSTLLSARHIREYTAFDLTYLLEGQNKEMYRFDETKIDYFSYTKPLFPWPRLAGILERYWPSSRSTLLVQAHRPDRLTLVHPDEAKALQGFYPVEEQEADKQGITRMLTTPFRWTGTTAEISLPASKAPFQIYYLNVVLLIAEGLPPSFWEVRLGDRYLTHFSLSPDRMFTQLRLLLPVELADSERFPLIFSGPSWKPLDHPPAEDYEFSLNDPRELGLAVGWDGFLRKDCRSFEELQHVARFELSRLERFENFDPGIHWRRLHHGYDDRWSHLQTLYLISADFKSTLMIGKNDWRQLGPGWYFRENWPEGPIRWTSRRAEAYLGGKSKPEALRLRVFTGETLLGERVSGTISLSFSLDRISFLPLTQATFDLPAGIWTDLVVAIPKKCPSPGVFRLVLTIDQSRSPSRLFPDSTDTRDLGLAVRGLTLD